MQRNDVSNESSFGSQPMRSEFPLQVPIFIYPIVMRLNGLGPTPPSLISTRMLCNPSPKKQVLSSCTKLDRVLNPSRSTKLWASFFFSFLTSTGGLSWVQDSDYRRCKANRGPAFRVERFSAARRQWKTGSFAGKNNNNNNKKQKTKD